MTKSEFIEWKSHPVTKEVFHAIRSLIETGRDELEYSDVDSLTYAKITGKLSAFRNILDISAEDIE